MRQSGRSDGIPPECPIFHQYSDNRQLQSFSNVDSDCSGIKIDVAHRPPTASSQEPTVTTWPRRALKSLWSSSDFLSDGRPPHSARSPDGDQCHRDFTAGMDRHTERCGSCKLRRGHSRPSIHRSSFDDRVLAHVELALQELHRAHVIARLCGALHHRDGRHRTGATPGAVGLRVALSLQKSPNPPLRRRASNRDVVASV